MGSGISGVIVIDKPGGMSSHDVVARVRKALQTRAVGHAGTLDPMATGVLVVAVGEATKLVPYLTAEDKAYEAEVTFGRTTDTLDAEGRVIEERAVPADFAAQLSHALEGERARTQQVPPAHSAIHTGGERAYAKARRGEEVLLEPRPVVVHRLELESVDDVRARLSLSVGKGYYVRSLARDLGDAVGCGAHLSALRRTASGRFDLAGAHALDAPDLGNRMLSIAVAAARALPVATLSERGEVDARAGRPIRADDLTRASDAIDCAYALLAANGRLVAVANVSAGGAKVLRGFNDPAT